MQNQYKQIAPEIYDVFEDEAVRKEFPRLEYVFREELYTPSFGWFSDAVVSKNEVFSACRGYKPNKPGHVEETEIEKDVE